MIVDDGGDMTLLIHEGVKAEDKFAADGSVPDPESTNNAEMKCVLALLRDSLGEDPQKWHKMAKVRVRDMNMLTNSIHFWNFRIFKRF